jgi:hypothetical protein
MLGRGVLRAGDADRIGSRLQVGDLVAALRIRRRRVPDRSEHLGQQFPQHVLLCVAAGRGYGDRRVGNRCPVLEGDRAVEYGPGRYDELDSRSDLSGHDEDLLGSSRGKARGFDSGGSCRAVVLRPHRGDAADGRMLNAIFHGTFPW